MLAFMIYISVNLFILRECLEHFKELVGVSEELDTAVGDLLEATFSGDQEVFQIYQTY